MNWIILALSHVINTGIRGIYYIILERDKITYHKISVTAFLTAIFCFLVRINSWIENRSIYPTASINKFRKIMHT